MPSPAQQAANAAARKARQRSPLVRLSPFATYADPLCAVKDTRLAALLDYWRGKGADGRLPARADIHPRDFVAHLPRIFMLDVHADGGFSFRLAGTAIVDLFGCEPTGKTLPQALGPQAGRLAAAVFTAVAGHARPMRTLGAIDWWTPPAPAAWFAPGHDVSHMSFEALHLPLSPDGAKVNIILSALVAHAGEDQPSFPEIPD